MTGALQEMAQTLVRKALDVDADRGGTGLMKPRISARDGLPSEQSDNPDARSLARCRRIANDLIEWIEADGQVDVVRRVLARWRGRSAAITLTNETGVLIEGEAGPEPANPLTWQRGAKIIWTARLPDRLPIQPQNEDDMFLPRDIAFWVAAYSAKTTGKARIALDPTGIAAAIRAEGDGTQDLIPALILTRLADGRRGPVAVEALADRVIEADGVRLRNGLEIETHDAPDYRVDDPTHLQTLLGLGTTLGNWTNANRRGVAENTATKCLGLGEPKILQPVARDPNTGALTRIPDDQSPPTFRVYVAMVPGGWNTQDDALGISSSFAGARTQTIHTQITLVEDPIEEPNKHYATATHRELVRKGLPELTERQLAKLDDSGLVREGEWIEPGDPVRLWYERVQLDDDTMSEEWSADRMKGFSQGGEVLSVKPYHDGAIGALEDGLEAEVAEERKARPPGRPGRTHGHQVIIRERLALGCGTKAMTGGATKGMMRVVRDDDVIHDDEGKPVDVMMDANAPLRRLSPADWLEIQLGHLAISRSNDVWEAVGAVALALNEADAPQETDIWDAVVQAPNAAESAAENALIKIALWRNQGMLAHLALHTGPDATIPLESLIPDGDAKVGDWDRALETLAVEREGLPEDEVLYDQNALVTRSCLLVPIGASEQDLLAIERALDYETDEECRGIYANARDAAAGTKMVHGGASIGYIDLRFPADHGRKQTNQASIEEGGIERTTGHPVSEKGRTAAKLGLMEQGAATVQGITPLVAEIAAYGTKRGRKEALERLHTGRALDTSWQTTTGAGESLRQLFAAIGVDWNEDTGRVRPLDRRDIEQRWPHDRTHDTDGSHIALPRPVLHPLFKEWARKVMGISRKEWNRMLRGHRIEQGPAGALPVETMDPRLGTNVPAYVAQRIERLAERAMHYPTYMLQDANEVVRRARKGTTAGGRPRFGLRDAEDHLEAVETLIRRPGEHPPVVLTHLTVLPKALRREFLRTGAPAERATADVIDTAYARLEGVCAGVKAADDAGQPLSDATRRITRAVDHLVREIAERRLGGKHAFINRAFIGMRGAHSARMTVLPVDPAKVPMTHAVIPYAIAQELYRPFVTPVLAREMGLDPQRPETRRRIKKALVDPTDRAHERARQLLYDAAMLSPIVLNRAPTLHGQGIVAVEAIIAPPNEDRHGAAYRHGEDRPAGAQYRTMSDATIGVHAGLQKAIGGDYDGDSIAIWVPLDLQVAEQCRAQLGIHAIAVKHGNGRVQIGPREGAQVACIRAVNDRHRGQSPLDRASEWLYPDDHEARRQLGQAPDAMPPDARAAWTDRTGAPTIAVKEWEAFETAVAGSPMRTRPAGVRIMDAAWRAGYATLTRYVAAPKLSWVRGLRTLCTAIGTLCAMPESERARALAQAGTDERNETAPWRQAMERLAASEAPEPLPSSKPKTNAQWVRASVKRQTGWIETLEALATECRGADRDAGPRRIAAIMSAGGISDATDTAKAIRGATAMLRHEGGPGLQGLVMQCAETGAPIRLTSEPYGVYGKRPMVGGLGFAKAIALHMGGAQAGLSNDAMVAKNGYLGELYAQATAHLQITATDCATQDYLEVSKQSLHEHQIGMVLAQGAHLGRWVQAGEILDATMIEAASRAPKADTTPVALRSPAGCRAESGLCAMCAGATTTDGGLPALRRAVGIRAGMSTNESTVQQALKRTHQAGSAGPHSLPKGVDGDGNPIDARRTPAADMLLNAFGVARTLQERERAMEWRPKSTADVEQIPKGALGAEYERSLSSPNPVPKTTAEDRIAHVAYLAARLGNVDIEPTHIRLIVHAMTDGDKWLGLHTAAQRRSPLRFAASTNYGENRIREVLENAARGAPLLGPVALHHRNGVPNPTDATPKVFVETLANDLKALKRRAVNAPQTMFETDPIGRNALCVARSTEAVRILLMAGLDPYADITHDPRGKTAYDVLRLRPEADRTMVAEEERTTTRDDTRKTQIGH